MKPIKALEPRRLPAHARWLLGSLLGGWAIAGASQAADTAFAPQVWLNPGVISHHFDRSRDFREDNVGFGAEIVIAPSHALMVGSFINSDRARTHYGAYEWRPLHWEPGDLEIRGGIALGAFDGYPRYHDGGWFVAPLPVLSIEGKRLGANVSVVPTLKDRVSGALLFQVKLRVW